MSRVGLIPCSCNAQGTTCHSLQHKAHTRCHSFTSRLFPAKRQAAHSSIKVRFPPRPWPGSAQRHCRENCCLQAKSWAHNYGLPQWRRCLILPAQGYALSVRFGSLLFGRRSPFATQPCLDVSCTTALLLRPSPSPSPSPPLTSIFTGSVISHLSKPQARESQYNSLLLL